MKFEPITCILKNGKSIEIRFATISDAQNLMDLKRSYIENTTTIPLTLDEYHNEPSKELEIINKYIQKPNCLLLVATHNNELIGNIDLTGSHRNKMSHTAMLGMGIKSHWRNQGLGKKLIDSAIMWAKEKTNLEIIWLEVYKSNELGNHLYKKTGFLESGIIPNFFKEESGYKDKVQMYLCV